MVSFLKTIPKPRHLCLEEGTHAGWLYEVLSPHVQEIVVAGVGGQSSRGPKDDKRDAFALAEGLRMGAIQARVYKGLGEFRRLRELSRAYSMVVSDSVRVQNRIKSVYYQELDAIRDLQKQAEKELLAEALQYRIYRILKSCPGMGSIRVAQMLPIVVTPYRFPSKRAFWNYAGLAIVMRSSSDWVRAADGRWLRAAVQQTRG